MRGGVTNTKIQDCQKGCLLNNEPLSELKPDLNTGLKSEVVLAVGQDIAETTIPIAHSFAFLSRDM